MTMIYLLQANNDHPVCCLFAYSLDTYMIRSALMFDDALSSYAGDDGVLMAALLG